MAEVEINKVSVSILHNLQRKAWKNKETIMQKVTKNMIGQLIRVKSCLRLAMEPTTRQKMRMRYIPTWKVFLMPLIWGTREQIMLRVVMLKIAAAVA